MPTLIELSAQIVTAQASSAAMTTDYIINALTRIHSTLEQLETGVRPQAVEEAVQPTLSLKDAFRENEVICLLCGKGFQTLGAHLRSKHQMSSREYRKQFAIPRSQPLSTQSLHEFQKSRVPPPSAKKALLKEAKIEAKPTEAPAQAPLKKRGRPRKSIAAVPA